MSGRLVVTGFGIISAIGKNTGENYRSLLEEIPGTGPIRQFATQHSTTIPSAEVKADNHELALLGGLGEEGKHTRTTLLAHCAFSEAVAGIPPALLQHPRTGLISANTVGGMDKSENNYFGYLRDRIYNQFIEKHDCADSTESLARTYGIRGPLTTVSTACSSSANAIILASRMIRNGSLDRAVAGGTECLTRFHLNGFNSLKILSPGPCKPFDAGRNGINLGEAAAYLVIESEETALEHERMPLCVISGWANTCEAFHATASSPEGDGAYRSMKKALSMAGLKPDDIGYINAHGTGTENNDLSEGRAISRIFGNNPPPFSSTKPYTGHTTSAAGSVEAIISILSLTNGILFPNLNFSEKMPELDLVPVTGVTPAPGLEHVLSNSFGFGGNNSSLIFSKYHPAQ